MTTKNDQIAKILEVDPRDQNAVLAGLAQTAIIPLKVAKIRLPVVASATAQDTGFDLPTKGVVLDAWLDVRTFEATGGTKTVDLGLLAGESGGDVDGFIDGLSVATSAGIKQPVLTKSAETVGLLLKYTITDNGSATHPQRQWHVLNGTAKSVVYVLGSDDFAELVCDAVIVYMDFTQLLGSS